MQNKRIFAAACAALFAAGHAGAQEKKEPVLDAIEVRASPFAGHSDLEMAQPASVLRGERLQRRQSTSLGDTLGTEPGVQSSSFGPGSGRPIIRGLDGPRIRVMDGAMGTSDLSTISPDHQATGEPISARQIEVLRGPATLLYGSGASGGVVNVVTNRIPESRQEGFYGSAELRGASGTREGAGVFQLDGGTGGFAWHLDGYKRKTGDYSIPGSQTPSDPASVRGRLPNSATDSDGFSLGGSWVGDRGFLGASYQKLNSQYGIPTPEAARIDMRQHRSDIAGELLDPLPGFTRLRAKLRDSRYEHAEIESTGEVGTIFKNDGREGRLELTHAPLAGWTGVLGLQLEKKDVSALGEEAIIPRTRQRSQGLFLVEDFAWRDLHFELGARGGKEKLSPDDPNPSRSISLASYSAGAIWKFTPGYALALNLASAQRAPSIEELYSNGAHVATASFEVGDPTLNKEKSRNIDLGLRKTLGAWRGKLGVFQNRIKDYIFAASADQDGDGIADRVDDAGTLDPAGEFLLVNFAQAEARFRGIEAEISYRPAPEGFGARLFGDRADGKLTGGGGNLPRISPARLGFEADYKQGPWVAWGLLLRVFRQDRVAMLETETPGYTRLDAGLEYAIKVSGKVTTTLFLRGNNLLDDDMRVHTSFIKDFAPLPGRSIVAGLRASF
ncbi:MAG: TonB-dependent receptor [Burkholderiales bacterium]